MKEHAKSHISLKEKCFFIYLLALGEAVQESSFLVKGRKKMGALGLMKGDVPTEAGLELRRFFKRVLTEYLICIHPFKYVDVEGFEMAYQTMGDYAFFEEWITSLSRDYWVDLRYAVCQYKKIPFPLVLFMEHFFLKEPIYMRTVPLLNERLENFWNNFPEKIQGKKYLTMEDFKISGEKNIEGQDVASYFIGEMTKTSLHLYQKEMQRPPSKRLLFRESEFQEIYGDQKELNRYLNPVYASDGWKAF